MKEKPLVLMDVDWTIFNGLFEFEPNGITEKIAAMVAAGWTFGLASDRPQSELQELYAELALNGPILAELGNVLIYPKQDVIKCLRTADERLRMKLFTRQATFKLVDEFPDLPILLASNTGHFREFHRLNWPQEKLLAAVHTARRTSFLVNVHRYTGAGLVPVGPEPVQSIARLLVPLFRHEFGCDPMQFVSEKQQGCVLLHFPDANKARCAKFMFDERLADSIAMIGDSTWDNLADPRAIQLAVGNADTEYKKACRFVARAPFSAGVVECLDWLEKNY
jgi:hydroxymethylpyrimidine pyrophosphatase-like HAD family hydrolase